MDTCTFCYNTGHYGGYGWDFSSKELIHPGNFCMGAGYTGICVFGNLLINEHKRLNQIKIKKLETKINDLKNSV